MNKKASRFSLWLFLGAAAIIALLPKPAAVQQNENPSYIFGSAANAQKAQNPKIQSALYKMIHPPDNPSLARALAAGLIHRTADPARDGLQVVVETASNTRNTLSGTNPETMLVRGLIQSFGGKVETVSENMIQTRVPLTAVEALAENDVVKRIRLPLRPHPHVVSEGVSRTGADAWQRLAAYRTLGRKPKIAVLDLGFQGYTNLLGSELPSTVTTHSFRADGNLLADQVHGAACAEIIYDMCPDVDLYLVNFDTDVEQHSAVDWLIANGVDIISYSIGWWNAGDGKGTGPIDYDVTRAADHGIIWASSAGNDALSHYEGTFSDTNSNNYHNFTSSNEILNIWVPSYQDVELFLNWDDWGTWLGTDYSGSNQDYDLELYWKYGTTWYFVDGSYNWQTGTQWPTEDVGGYYSSVASFWGAAILRYSTTRNCKLELFTYGNSATIQYDVPAGSISIPADAVAAMAAGAVDATSDAYNDDHLYSGRGPTHDGRTKPDFGSPSGVSTATYGTYGFYGTSPSAPHLAGAFGLLRSKTGFSNDQIRQMLTQRAITNFSGYDVNRYGAGRLSLFKK